MSKLPVWHTVGQSYAFTFRNLGLLVRVAWIWFAVFAAAVWLFSALSFDIAFEGTIEAILSGLLFTVAGSAVAVAWHRAILIDARPSSEFSISFGHRELAYFLITILITVACYVAILAIVISVVQFIGPGLTALTTLVAIVITLLLVITRISLKISAITVDDAAMTFARSWALTRGATWRLTIGFLACAVPLSSLMLPVRVTGLALDGQQTPHLATAINLIGGAFSFVAIAVAAAFLSFAYLRLVPEDEKATAGVL